MLLLILFNESRNDCWRYLYGYHTNWKKDG
nr:MAG TPA: hypothetical protein [Caudoviricetes sp.]